MTSVYGTGERLLEQLALNEDLSISQLAKASGLSYPTALYSASSLPCLEFEKTGRERRVRIKDNQVDAVYPFLIMLQTNKAKRTLLMMAYLSRKGFKDALVGGELALETQFLVKDSDPDPQIEIRAGDQDRFADFVHGMPNKGAVSELHQNVIVEDSNIRPANTMGLVKVSKPEKLLTDAIAEKRSRIFVENILETITSSHYQMDLVLLNAYAQSRGVLDEVLHELEAMKGYGFP